MIAASTNKVAMYVKATESPSGLAGSVSEVAEYIRNTMLGVTSMRKTVAASHTVIQSAKARGFHGVMMSTPLRARTPIIAAPTRPVVNAVLSHGPNPTTAAQSPATASEAAVTPR